MSVPPPINVSGGHPASSPLPSPSFSLAPQRSTSMRMTTPNAANAPTAGGSTPSAPSTQTNPGKNNSKYNTPPSSNPSTDSNPLSSSSSVDPFSKSNSTVASDRSSSTGGYSLRGGRLGAASRNDYEERIDRERVNERGNREFERRPTERREFGSKSTSTRGGRAAGGEERTTTGGGQSGASATGGEKKLSAAQQYANTLPVVGLLETPPSPTLPAAFHQPARGADGAAGTNEPANPFSVLSDGDADVVARVDAIDEELDPFPLASKWTVYFDKKAAAGKGKSAAVPPKLQGGHADPLSSYESNLQVLSHFETVQEFWHLQNHLLPPSQLEQNSTIHFFKEGIKPVWEDPANRGGGKWIFRITPKDKHLLDHFWQNILLACIGGTMDESDTGDEICGVVLSKRRMGDRIAVWNRHREDTASLISLGHRFRAAMLDGLEPEHNPTIHLSYEDNEETLKTGYCAFGSNVRFNL